MDDVIGRPPQVSDMQVTQIDKVFDKIDLADTGPRDCWIPKGDRKDIKVVQFF